METKTSIFLEKHEKAIDKLFLTLTTITILSIFITLI